MTTRRIANRMAVRIAVLEAALRDIAGYPLPTYKSRDAVTEEQWQVVKFEHADALRTMAKEALNEQKESIDG